VERLELGLQKAQATPTLRDDIRAYQQIATALEAQEAALQARIALAKTDKGLQNELLGIQRQQLTNEQALAAAVKERAANQKAAALTEVRARQFRKLGLTGTGDEPIPGAAALRRQLGTLDQAIEGTFLDTTKTESLLSRIRQVLSGGLGKVGEEVRRKVKAIIDDLNQQLRSQDTGPLTQFHKANMTKLLEGLGLSADELIALRRRLSRVGSGGFGAGSFGGAFGVSPGAPLAVGGAVVAIFHHQTVLDGQVVEESVTRQQERRAGRNATPRRGAFAGR
jgi:hypothetical protein